MTSRIKFMSGAVAALVVAIAVLALAGCGSGTTTKTVSPTPTGGAVSALAAMKAYRDQLQPITQQFAATVGKLPDAVKGLNKKPDATWTTAADNLDAIAAELGSEAAALTAVTPPDQLKGAQDAVVSGITATQGAVTKVADALRKGQATAATAKGKVQSQITTLAQSLSLLSSQLNAVAGGSSPSPMSSPMASPTP